MAKVSQIYETIIVISTTLGEENIKSMVEKFKTLIADNGTMLTIDEWGKRRLAYQINDESEGYYILFQFESKPEFPSELDRVCKITDGILRWMSVAIDQPAVKAVKEEPAQADQSSEPAQQPAAEAVQPAANESQGDA